MPLFREHGEEPHPEELDDRSGRVRRELVVSLGRIDLPGELVVPEHAGAIVVFAHGTGSSRHSPRNLAVAERLNDAGLGTLLFDLLSVHEAEDRDKVFDIPLLARRLEAAAESLWRWPGLGDRPVAFFGASTGAAAALVAAANLGIRVTSVVSRGGRPDLAGDALERVTAPTMLIVGGDDHDVLALNRDAETRLRCEHRLEIVPDAGHLFEEEGALERVAELAAGWFVEHVGDAGGQPPGSSPPLRERR
jgi:putative phosphoribosyl transferase